MSALGNAPAVEVNFDGLVGPTHNYGGLSFGNVASTNHAAAVSHPRQAALQGLAKMKLLHDLGVKQAVLPPHPRPHLTALRNAGFAGSDADLLMHAHRSDPRLLAAVYSSSFMWTANAATVSPSSDTTDRRVHFTPANLISKFHRSIETQFTAQLLRSIFNDDRQFVHHDALPAEAQHADEGAANHFRLCEQHHLPGVEVFVFGREQDTPPFKYPARQSKSASSQVAESHLLDPSRCTCIQQSRRAIEAGAFHNDVVVASNQNVLLLHHEAFENTPAALREIEEKFASLGGQKLWVFAAQEGELSLQDAVETYLFNSQIVTRVDGSMVIIAPLECRNHKGVQRYLNRVLQSGCPVRSVQYLDLRQSMNNGGGPACLRLRVVLTTDQMNAIHPGVCFNDRLHDGLCNIIQTRYRTELWPADLADPEFMRESLQVVQDIRHLMGL